MGAVLGAGDTPRTKPSACAGGILDASGSKQDRQCERVLRKEIQPRDRAVMLFFREIRESFKDKMPFVTKDKRAKVSGYVWGKCQEERSRSVKHPGTRTPLACLRKEQEVGLHSWNQSVISIEVRKEGGRAGGG